jgi:hypothetical protein
MVDRLTRVILKAKKNICKRFARPGSGWKNHAETGSVAYASQS